MADTDEKLSIHVKVADRVYPLKIERSREAKARAAAKRINDKLLQNKESYGNLDMQDCLALAALQFVSKLIDEEGKQDNAPFIDGLAELDDWLANYLEKQNISSFK